MIGVFILVIFLVIFLASAQAYSNGSLENGAGQNALDLGSINSSNSSLLKGMLYLNGSQVAIAGNMSLIVKNPVIHFINKSNDFNYNDSYNHRLANASLYLKNLSNLSRWSETPKINLSKKKLYNSKELGINLVDTYSKPMELKYALQAKLNNSTHGEGNLVRDPILHPTIQELDKTTTLKDINQSSGSMIIVVHPGERIQDAINVAAPGDIIEIDSGTYNESLQIDKPLTIRGINIGGGLPIIDSGGMGNAIEINADKVILKDIVSTNSSNSSMSPGAGIRFSSSKNSSIDGIISYNNYYGIDLADSSDNRVSNSDISNNQIGMRIYYSNDNKLYQNNVNNNINPMIVVSSTGNIIEGNIFKNNLKKVETIPENKIRNNKEIFAENDDKGKTGVIRNTESRTQPSKHSESGEDKVYLVGRSVPANEAKNCNILAHKAAAGTVVFNPPKIMTIGVSEWIDARIGLENTTSLVEGLLGKGDAQFRNINVSMNMTYVVKLESDSGFEISEKRPAAQMLGKDPAVWLWSVKPLEAGNHTLILSVDLQVEEPPYNSRCVNVTYWPVAVRVLDPSPQQRATDILNSSYKMVAGSMAFLASTFSLILLFRQLRKGKDEKK